MHDTAHIIMTLDITKSAWLKDLCHKAFQPRCLGSLKKFYGRCQDLIDIYQRLVKEMVSNSFPG